MATAVTLVAVTASLLAVCKIYRWYLSRKRKGESSNEWYVIFSSYLLTLHTVMSELEVYGGKSVALMPLCFYNQMPLSEGGLEYCTPGLDQLREHNVM